MQCPIDNSTIELTRTRMKLRSDLRFIPQQYGRETFYHIEVPGTSAFYRVGYAEYTFISLLNGDTSFAEALAIAAQVSGSDALSQEKALIVYSWLLDKKLANIADAGAQGTDVCKSLSVATQSADSSRSFNPLWIMIPVASPDRFLRAMLPYTGWMFSFSATVAGLMLMLSAGIMIRNDWTRFWKASETVFSPNNWLWLFIAWIGLKALHETAHGLVCVRYGGSVRRMGIVLAFFAPLPWVDATSCWSFRSRGQRLHTAAAGIYVELLAAAVAAVVWCQCDSANYAHLLHNVIVMASLSTMLFNLNPLMRFDGYYMLSDLLNIPNLSGDSMTAVNDTLRRWIIGGNSVRLSATGVQHHILFTYGILTVIWRGLVCSSILIAASAFYHGAGIALTIVGIIIWIGRPLYATGKSCVEVWKYSRLQFVRGLLLISTVITSAGLLVFAAPAPVMITAPGIVDYSSAEVVRAAVPGFVAAIHVSDGQTVRAGDLLAELKNPDIVTEYLNLYEICREEEIRLQKAVRENDSGTISIARSKLASLRIRLMDSEAQQGKLSIYAQVSGQVIGRQLNFILGRYIEAGEEILTIGSEKQKEFRLSIGAKELDTALRCHNDFLNVRVGTRTPIRGQLMRISPAATRKLVHPAMSAASGGPLEVIPSENAKPGTTHGLLLTEHRFDGVISLSEADAVGLRCGERGAVSFGLPSESVGQYFCHSVRRWVRERIEQAFNPDRRTEFAGQ